MNLSNTLVQANKKTNKTNVDIMFQLRNGIWGDRATARVVKGATCAAISAKKIGSLVEGG